MNESPYFAKALHGKKRALAVKYGFRYTGLKVSNRESASVAFLTCKGSRQETLPGSAHGEMAEWTKAPVSKTGVRATVPWVRIPLSPPPHPQMACKGLPTEQPPPAYSSWTPCYWPGRRQRNRDPASTGSTDPVMPAAFSRDARNRNALAMSRGCSARCCGLLVRILSSVPGSAKWE